MVTLIAPPSPTLAAAIIIGSILLLGLYLALGGDA